VPIHDAGEVEGQLYLVMRYVAGRDLKALLADGPVAPERAVAICGRVADALDAAHTRGLVHRDVKPSNVLLDEREHVYLADFGLTRRLSGRPAGDLGLSLGTPDYAAPEQIRGERADGRADVYSFGCLLYECLMGVPPFRRATDAAVLFAHLREEPPAPPGLEDVIAKALAKSPDDRFQTCGQLVESARQALGLSTPRRARVQPVVATLGLALTGAALLAFFLTRGGGPAPPATSGRLIRIDPTSNRVEETVRVGNHPTGVAVGAGRVWVTAFDDSSVWRLDPRTSESRTISANSNPIGIVVNGGVVYVANGFPANTVTRIDAESGGRLDVVSPAAVGLVRGVSSIGAGEGIWIATATAVARLSTGTSPGAIVKRIPVSSPSPLNAAHSRFDLTAVAVGAGAVWAIGDAIDRRLWRIDPNTRRVVATLSLPFIPRALAAGGGAVWVTAQLDDTVSRIDPRTNRIVATIDVGREPTAVAVGDRFVWVADAIDEAVAKIDPRSNQVVATIPVSSSPKAVAVGRRSVWVASDAS
jgi:YVTN family beta-propeller protein